MSDTSREKVGLHLTSDPDETQIGARQETAGAKKSVQLPLRLLLVSDLTPQAPTPDWTGPSKIRRVDNQRFGDLIAQLAPRLRIDVPNRISEAPKELEIELSLPNLDAFHPAQLARQVPELAGLLEIRSLVGEVQGGEIDLETFRARLEETGVDRDWADQLYETLSAPPKPGTPSRKSAPTASSARPKQPPAKSRQDDDPLDRLLSMVDVDAGEEAPAEDVGAAEEPEGMSGLKDALMRAVTGETGAGPSLEKSAAETLLADLDEVLSDQVNAILNHPSVRRLEAAWRGLKFLVDRINFRENIQLDVLPAAKTDLSEALYHQVLLPEHGDTDRVPLSAIVLDAAFDRDGADVELLEDLAGTAASLQVPLLASVAPSFFGVAKVEGLARLPALRQHLEGPEYIAWNKLRGHEHSSQLVLVLPSFLLRYPYGPDRPVKAFDLKEAGHLWAGGALAVAVAMAASFAETGWPTRLNGPGQAAVEDLPIWNSSAGAIPLAALLSEQKQDELRDAGFTVLGCRPNHDAAYIAEAATVHRPDRYEDPAATAEARAHDTLACRLFVARAAHFLLMLQEEVADGGSLAEVQADVAERLQSFLATSGHGVPDESVYVEHVAEASTAEYEMLAVRLRPPPAVLSPPVSLVLGLQVPRGG